MFCVLARYRLYSQSKCKVVSITRLCNRKMSEKANTILNASDNWFNKYAVITDAPEGIFKGVSDRFNGITVDSNLEACNPDKFPSVLQDSLSYWMQSKKRGIWFKVHLNCSSWIPVLVKSEFKFHHAKDSFVMMYRWLPTDEIVNIPPFAHTMIGVGALVTNNKNEILVVSEKHALIKGSWKLPGGYVEPGENFVDAAIREVFEETNVKTTFDSVISIRHAHGAGFGCSDLYVVMALVPENNEIKKCDREIDKCEWMSIDDYLKHPKVHDLNREFVQTYLAYKKRGVKMVCKEGFHQILKKRYDIYSVEFEEDGPSKL